MEKRGQPPSHKWTRTGPPQFQLKRLEGVRRRSGRDHSVAGLGDCSRSVGRSDPTGLCLELRDIRTTTGGPNPFAGGFNEKSPIPLEQRPTGCAKSTDFELVEAPVPAPGFWRNTRKVTLAIEANTEKFALPLLSLRNSRLARSVSNIDGTRS
jgi:hypothetical protein